MRRLGIMQGRLSAPEDGRHQCFPALTWREEYARAAAAGLDAIEWLWDVYGQGANPLETDEGVREMKALSERHGVAVRSICADYFMAFPLVRVSGQDLADRQKALGHLIARCGYAGITRIVLPILDASRIETREDDRQMRSVLRAALPEAEAAGVAIHLETSLEPAPFADLLADLDHPLIRVNYDSGNSASLGFNMAEEFAAYGHRIGSIHIKDRPLGARTVPLGTGSVDFADFAKHLRAIDYKGDFILEAARGLPGEEVDWSRGHRLFVEANLFSGLAA